MNQDGRCRFCHRWQPILDGLYQRMSFPDGIANVCDDCMAKRDEPDPDVVEWRDTEVEVAP